MAPDGFVAFCIDQIFPERCIICGAPTSPRTTVQPSVMPASWPCDALEFFRTGFSVRLFPGLRVTARVLCTACWLGMEPAGREDRATGARSGGGRDGACLAGSDDGAPVPVIAPFLTNEFLLEVVRYLKFAGGIRAVDPLSWWMALALRRFLASADARDAGDTLITPVPLHPARLRRRGYNQAALLASRTAMRLGLPFDDRVIVRTRNTPYQSHLPEKKRALNVRGAFDLRRGASVTGTRVVLVDDLVTTGETVASCVRIVREGRPVSVVVLAAGRKRGM